MARNKIYNNIKNKGMQKDKESAAEMQKSAEITKNQSLISSYLYSFINHGSIYCLFYFSFGYAPSIY